MIETIDQVNVVPTIHHLAPNWHECYKRSALPEELIV